MSIQKGKLIEPKKQSILLYVNNRDTQSQVQSKQTGKRARRSIMSKGSILGLAQKYKINS